MNGERQVGGVCLELTGALIKVGRCSPLQPQMQSTGTEPASATAVHMSRRRSIGEVR